MQKNRKYAHLKFEKPLIKKGELVAGVYKIVFDDKWFYIGSTGDLRKRFSVWPTISAAAKDLKLYSSNIRKVLKGQRKTTNGYILKYAS